MGTISEDDVRSVLNGVIDPCSITAGVPAGMNDMGLITEVDVDDHRDGQRIRVKFGLTDPTCMLFGAFFNEARQRLGDLPGVSDVEVTLDHDLDWAPDLLAPDYQRRLNEHRAAQRERLLPLTPVGHQNAATA